jgi:hypothetical protein
MILVAIFQIAVPLLLIGSLALIRKPSLGVWLLNLIAFGMVISFMWASARWDASSLYFRNALPVLFIIAAVVGFKRIRIPEKKPTRVSFLVGIVVNLALIVLMSGFNWFSFRGYLKPTGAVDLQSPLRENRVMVLNGGASPFTNAHFRLRAQGYALDILGLTQMGSSSNVFGDRSNLESYPIFDTKVFSPCEGVVSAVKDDFQDQRPPLTDEHNPAGNHVLIECKGVEVLLAHLKQGSVLVTIDDSVTVETELGRVGNTGNTSEPHLHIHAEDGGEPGVFLDGRSVPITINNRFLVRGNTISSGNR